MVELKESSAEVKLMTEKGERSCLQYRKVRKVIRTTLVVNPGGRWQSINGRHGQVITVPKEHYVTKLT